MPSPRISVLLPFFNAAGTLAKAVFSIQGQSEPDWELLAIDDGSTDHGAEIITTFAQSDPRIILLRQRSNQGIVAALNLAITHARGKFLARMDADDISYPERLRKQKEFLATNPEIGLVGSYVDFGGNRATHAGYAAYVDWTNSLSQSEEIALNRFVESPFAHPSVMFRKELPKQFGGYRQGNFPEDYELWLRWLDAGVKMAKIPEPLLFWSDPPRRLSRTDSRYNFRAFYRCKADYLARWLKRHNPHHPEIIVWGAGRKTRKRAEMLAVHGIQIVAYIDIDPRKIGQRIHGRPVLAESEIPPPESAFIIPYVGSRGARDDIRVQLSTRGFREGQNYIMGA